jgi:hypothetical protein
VLCEFFASEHGWGPDKIAGLDNAPAIMHVEQAPRRREQTRRESGPSPAGAAASQPETGGRVRPATRTGRPRKAESSKERLVIGALARHHRYESVGIVATYTPAKPQDLAEQASGKEVRVSAATVSRFFKRRFPQHERGYDGYVAACNRDARVHIGMLLAFWQGEVTERCGNSGATTASPSR